MSKPFLDKKATDQLNLSVLRRVDPDTEQVLATAGHVALYDFDKSKKAWTRKDVEGSLFLLKRQTQPRFKIIILNKKSQDNFVEDVLGGFQFEVATPYVLYRNKLDEVVGIWFYNETECATVAGLLQRITSAFAGQAPPDPQLAPQAPEAQLISAAKSPAQPNEAQIIPSHEDDAFWDRASNANSAAAAESGARMLQPAIADSPQAGPSGTSGHGRGAFETPFAEAAQQPPQNEANGSASGQPVQAHVQSMMQKLANGQQGLTQGQPDGGHSSPPNMFFSPGAAASSPSLQGPGPLGDAQQQNPLSALFANMKVNKPPSTPTALTPPPSIRPPAGGVSQRSESQSQTPAATPPPSLNTPSGSLPPPMQQQPALAASSPALMTPSFLRQRSNPVDCRAASSQQKPDSDDSLRQVLSRAASKTLQQPDFSTEGSQAHPTSSASMPDTNSTSARDTVRQAIVALASSDTFVDDIVHQLQSKGMLR